jgi:hypothetical protein
MDKILKYFGQRITPGAKKRILGFSKILKFKNLIFIASFGAVTNERIEPLVTKFDEPSTKSQDLLSNICEAIEEANSRMFWPVRMKLRLLEGMSGQSFRLVLNRLSRINKNYLEIGTWRGSTACAAIDGNEINAWLVDDWSEFGGPADGALKNLSQFVGEKTRLSILSQDFKNVDFSSVIHSEIDTYFFDGPHSFEDHLAGAKIINSLQFDSLVFIVDDWNWEDVRNGTLAGLATVEATVIFKVEVFPKTGSHFQYSRWHNGYCFFVLEKSPKYQF